MPHRVPFALPQTHELELRTAFPSLQSLSSVQGKHAAALKAGLDAARECDLLRAQLALANGRAEAAEERAASAVGVADARVRAKEEMVDSILAQMSASGLDHLNRRISTYFSPPPRRQPPLVSSSEPRRAHQHETSDIGSDVAMPPAPPGAMPPAAKGVVVHSARAAVRYRTSTSDRERNAEQIKGGLTPRHARVLTSMPKAKQQQGAPRASHQLPHL